MAHVVGVPKRDPCQKCLLPVFLAERLTVGKHIYHRTCLKCARCNSQLTPGSFYETEIDGEFCCETCPDEEKSLNVVTMPEPTTSSVLSSLKDVKTIKPSLDNDSIGGSTSGRAAVVSGRTSIADRLAFFENDGKKLLQKSLSDEEKSQSLKKFTETQNVYKHNSALSNFINTHLTDEADSMSEQSKTTERRSSNSSISSKSSKSSSSSNDTTNNDTDEELQSNEQNQPPELPKSQPPSLATSSNISDIESSISIYQPSEEASLESSANVDHNNLSLISSKSHNDDNNVNISNNEDEHSKKETPSIKLIEDNEKQQIIIISNNIDQITNKIDKNELKEISTQLNSQQLTTSSEIHNNDHLNLSLNVTKDNSENDEQMRTKIIKKDLIETTIEGNTETTNKSANQIMNPRKSSSMVRARLHQFEIIANNSPDSSISSINSNNSNISYNNINKINISESINLPDKNDTINTTSMSKSIKNTIIETEVPKNVSNQDDINENNNHNLNNILKIIDSETKTNDNEETMLNASYHSEITINNDEKLKEKLENIENSWVTDENIENSTVMNENVDKPKENIGIDMKMIEINAQQNQSEEDVHLMIEQEIDDKISKENLSKSEEYPEDLNPFKSDDEEDNSSGDAKGSTVASISIKEKRKSLNPFDSSDEENENLKSTDKKIKPPRPPPPKKISTNPFGSDSEDESIITNSSITPKKMPVPTPRIHTSTTSLNHTPEPTPRLARQNYDNSLKNSGDFYGSSASLTTTNTGVFIKTPIDHFNRDNDTRSSTHSVASSSGSVSGGSRSRKIKKAPAPLPPQLVVESPQSSSGTILKTAKELFPTQEIDSKKSTQSSSTPTTPLQRKKRPAPAPPSMGSKLNLTQSPVLTRSKSPNSEETNVSDDVGKKDEEIEKSKLSDEDKFRLEETNRDDISRLEELKRDDVFEVEEIDKKDISRFEEKTVDASLLSVEAGEPQEIKFSPATPKRRLIALDVSLLEDSNVRLREERNVVYRRVITPLPMDTPTAKREPPFNDYKDENVSHDRQLEKLKDNKEAKNRNRQSQVSLSPTEENDPLYNKSVHGKWKRRKGPAPALPVPPKKVLQMLPLQEIRHELEIIEVQQQGLEKQGVMLEKMIRERCEGNPDKEDGQENESNSNPSGVNSKEVEDLILQLFELVNEKNELFRRQAELMYLRRQHRLEQEQADIEYEIRVLMAQPERNKTDSDKAREESLIARLVEVVQLRNEVIDCLEMDRLREAEEDLSIKQRLEMHTAKRDEELCKQTPTKLSKKEKKKQKESKKLGKSKKLDADKDADESELNAEKQKLKLKKKKKFLF